MKLQSKELVQVRVQDHFTVVPRTETDERVQVQIEVGAGAGSGQWRDDGQGITSEVVQYHREK